MNSKKITYEKKQEIAEKIAYEISLLRHEQYYDHNDVIEATFEYFGITSKDFDDIVEMVHTEMNEYTDDENVIIK